MSSPYHDDKKEVVFIPILTPPNHPPTRGECTDGSSRLPMGEWLLAGIWGLCRLGGISSPTRWGRIAGGWCRRGWIWNSWRHGWTTIRSAIGCSRWRRLSTVRGRGIAIVYVKSWNCFSVSSSSNTRPIKFHQFSWLS